MPFLNAFNSMSMLYEGTSNGQSFNGTASFNVDYRSSTTIKVGVTYSSGGTNEVITAWVLNNGTTVAVNFQGYNVTGSEASGFVEGLFASFYIELETGQNLGAFTSNSQFHSTGTSSVTLGPTTMTVTNYAANALPVTVNYCGGSETLTSYQLSVGTPPNTSFAIITYFSVAGTSSSGSFDYTLKVTSISVA